MGENMKTIRIGCGTGFYGDSHLPAIRMIEEAGVDYVCFEELSELTLAILKKDMLRDPSLGFTRSIPAIFRDCLPVAKKRGVKLITNGGGLNPKAAAEKVLEIARQHNIKVRIAVIQGDSLLDSLESFMPMNHLETGEPLPKNIQEKMLFCNAYLGAWPIVEALSKNVDVVIAGRIADSSLFLAPLIYEFGWSYDDYTRVACGALAGHLLECAAQITGGNHGGRWQDVPRLEDISYPLAEVSEDGRVIISKVEKMGGKVSFDTVREQLLYEVHNPFAYITPDVILDFSKISLVEIGPDRVEVRGILGSPPPPDYKVICGYEAGYMGQAIIGYSWPDALQKARVASEILKHKMAAMNISAWRVEYLGYNSLHGPLSQEIDEDLVNEVYLRVAIKTSDKLVAELLSRLAVPLALSGPPTASGFIGFDRTRSLIGFWPTYARKDLIDSRVTVEIMEVS